MASKAKELKAALDEALDDDEFRRLVLIGLAELVRMVGDFTQGGPRVPSGTYIRVADELRSAAVVEE